MKKKIPTFSTGEEAERFVDAADLSEYDLSGLTPVRFEFEKKTAQLNMRLPKPLLEAVKQRASARGIPYMRFIREAAEMALARPEKLRRAGKSRIRAREQQRPCRLRFAVIRRMG